MQSNIILKVIYRIKNYKTQLLVSSSLFPAPPPPPNKLLGDEMHTKNHDN